MEQNYPSSVQILDYFHAMEYLGNFAKVAYSDEQTRSDWIKRQKELILDDQIEKVIKTIKKACRTNN